MTSMEFTWRMVGTLIWPAVVLAVLIAYRPWITEKIESLRVRAGGFEGEVKVLNAKVDTIGRDIATTLSEMPQPVAEDEIPTSLVDLIPLVTTNRSEGLHSAFGHVLKALRENYPQLRGVPPSQLPQAMQNLVDRGQMEANVAASVRQLQELLEMPEWNSDQVGDTRRYAFLMLAEGAIHEILRTAQHRATGTNGGAPAITAPPIRSAWRGTYGRYPLELHILGWDGTRFTGIMTYPDDDTVTSVSGQANGQPGNASVSLSWQEQGYTLRGRRDIDFNGSYAATVNGDHMDAKWRRGNQTIGQFTMTAAVAR
ncbi:MAG TPA: hypothetical protein VGS19_18555 [Streptosporangiaceae bacterium]|nr:hypothetical protein [Streptosporangiaceae bacterium]